LRRAGDDARIFLIAQGRLANRAFVAAGSGRGTAGQLQATGGDGKCY
jgi:hypothetical protein